MDASIRTRLLPAILATPGVSTRVLAGVIGLSESTTAYHLRRLVRAGEVRSQVVGRDRCWYAAACPMCPILKRALPRLRREPVAILARTLGETPMSSSDLAARSGLERGSVRWAAHELERTFLAQRTPGGRLHLREGADVCVAKGLAEEACGLWGECPVSAAWRNSLYVPTGRMPKGK